MNETNESSVSVKSWETIALDFVRRWVIYSFLTIIVLEMLHICQQEMRNNSYNFIRNKLVIPYLYVAGVHSTLYLGVYIASFFSDWDSLKLTNDFWNILISQIIFGTIRINTLLSGVYFGAIAVTNLFEETRTNDFRWLRNSLGNILFFALTLFMMEFYYNNNPRSQGIKWKRMSQTYMYFWLLKLAWPAAIMEMAELGTIIGRTVRRSPVQVIGRFLSVWGAVILIFCVVLMPIVMLSEFWGFVEMRSFGFVDVGIKTLHATWMWFVCLGGFALGEQFVLIEMDPDPNAPLNFIRGYAVLGLIFFIVDCSWPDYGFLILKTDFIM